MIRREITEKLRAFVNENSLENGSDTPDHILAEYIYQSIKALNQAVGLRDDWHNPGLELVPMEKERLAWSLQTFPDATPQSALNHLKEEIKEIEQNIADGVNDATEYADAIMLLLDSAGRRGISVVDILYAFRQKHEINKTRRWEKNPDGSYYHVKDEK